MPFGLHQIAFISKIAHNLFSGFIAAETVVSLTVYNLCVVVKDEYMREIVARSHFKVVGVVAGSYLNTARTEVAFNIFVGNYWKFTINKRQNTGFAD